MAQRRSITMTRREALRRGMLGLGLVATGGHLYACGGNEPTQHFSNLANVGPLQEPDENGVRLPEGFTSRIVARTLREPTPASAYRWHLFPDGGATFAADDGGWVYVSNSEVPAPAGGVSALRFNRFAEVVDAYPILSGTNTNCAGGVTPWGTWLSCEEYPRGLVWECDPFGRQPAEAHLALGVFEHEAVAVDPFNGLLYLTEDVSDGRLYRYVPDNIFDDGRIDLDNGTLEVARVLSDTDEGPVEWLTVPDPTFSGDTPTRLQVGNSTPFRGGEGIWYSNGVIYFTTKGDDRVWTYEVETSQLAILYDPTTSDTPILTGVDNLTASDQGDILVAEDGGDMEIVAFVPTGEIVSLVQVVGHEQSEVAGPAFDPSGTRLYFSSQRGAGSPPTGGITYEVTGPFFV